MLAAVRDALEKISGTIVHDDDARAVLRELDVAGYALVPKKPTDEMAQALHVWETRPSPEAEWATMLAAAPKFL